MVKKITENADFDYGYDDPTLLRTYKIRPHDFKSRPSGKVRYTGNYADNAMYDDSKINESENSLLDRLHDMLRQADVGDDEIVGGLQLTAKGTQKVAAGLGIAGSEVEMMLNSLTAKLRREREISEGPERFSYEHDYLDNVTVRDGTTGDEKFVRGSKGADLLSKLKKSKNDQAILRQTVDEAVAGTDDWIARVRDKHEQERQAARRPKPEGSLLRRMFGKKDKLRKAPDDAKQNMGSFNFHWEYHGKSGTGTAQFRSLGQRVRVDVLSTRDRFGREYQPDPETMAAIQRQAYDAIDGGVY